MGYFLFLFLLTFSSIAQATEYRWQHAISMHDRPALVEDFEKFPYASDEAVKGGIFKQAVVGSFDSLNPNIVKGKAAKGSGYLFGRLMARSWDEPFTMYPWIAEFVEMDEERRWIKFKLNPKARFSDGKPLTTKDVLFSFETLKEKGRPNFRNVYSLVKDVIVVDGQIIEFHMHDDANREAVMIMSLMPIYAEHYWKDKEFDQTILEPFVTSGAYQLKHVDAGRSVTFERVKDYWAADIPSLKGHYNFDELVYDYYRDEHVLHQAFQAGDFDLKRETNPYKWITDYNFKNDEIIKYEVKHQRPEEIKALIFNTRKEIFSRKDVRIALRDVFDFNWVNKTLFNGVYKQANSIYPNSELAFQNEKSDERLSNRKRLKQADELLQKNGYNVIDGKRVNSATQEPLTFEILLQDPSQEKVVLSYVGTLKKLGIQATVRTVDSAQFFARLNDFDFDMVLFKWHSSLSPGNEQAFYWGTKFADIQGSRNYSRIKDEQIDQLIEELIAARTREDLIKTTKSLDQKIMEGAYFVPLYYDGFDRLAHKSTLSHSDYVPLYGPILETWWNKAN